jgi:photosystem II stability/assembly factor-like uncharacterized protein
MRLMALTMLKICLITFLLQGEVRVWADWRPIGPFGGHALKILLDPSNPQDLFVATKNGQIYRSKNAGERWESLPLSLHPSSLLQAIAMNPENSKQLYVGVAEGSGSTTASSMGGVYKSEDGGESWSLLPSTQDWSVLSLAIHRKNPDIVVVGAMDGVYRTENGGQEWHRISPANHSELKGVVSLALDAQDTQIIYAGTAHLPWRSLDGGATWHSIHQGMIDDSDVFSLSVDRTNPEHMFASACSGIYRSGNRGDQWTKMQGIPGTNRRTHIILQDPVDERILYAGTTQGLWKSLDGGLTWQKPNSYPYVINSIAIHPTDHNQLYLATDRSGILKSLDGGRSYQSINEGFINRNISRFLSEDKLYATSDYDGDFGGIFASPDLGRSWLLRANQLALKGKNVISLAVSPTNPNIIFAGTYEGLLKSENQGMTWKLVTGTDGRLATRQAPAVKRKGLKTPDSRDLGVKLPESKIFDVQYSTTAPNTLYLATPRGLFRSTDNGVIWKDLPGPVRDSTVDKIGLHPVDPQWVLAQSFSKLFISHDQGRTWSRAEFGEPNVKVYDFAFGAGTSSSMLAATSHGLFKSMDGGKTWILHYDPLPRIPYHQICSSRRDPSTVYLLSQEENQVYQSLDGGETWSAISNRGLAGIRVLALHCGSGDEGEMLYLVTENRGIYAFSPDGVPPAPQQSASSQSGQ